MDREFWSEIGAGLLFFLSYMGLVFGVTFALILLICLSWWAVPCALVAVISYRTMFRLV